MDYCFARGASTFYAGLVVSALMVMTPPAAAQDVNEVEANRAAIARSFEAWHAGTGSPYDLLAEDVSWTIVGNSATAKTYPSRDAFIGEVIRPFNARMQSRLVPTMRRLYAEGDTVIAFFDASGTARDGRPYTNTYAWILEMRNGRIVRANAFLDNVALDDLWQRVEPASSTSSGRPEGGDR